MNDPAGLHAVILFLSVVIVLQLALAGRRRRQHRASLRKLALDSTLAMLKLITLCDKRLFAAERRHADHDMMSFFLDGSGPSLDVYSDVARHIRTCAKRREADRRRSMPDFGSVDEMIAAMASGGPARGAEAPSEAPLHPEPDAHERAPHVTLNEMAHGFEEHHDGPAPSADQARPEGPATYRDSLYGR